ncbi:MAG: hypothetical protein K0S67_1796 [Nitrososphaeraceae archaeon]|nr:hypothetical protein [Nitrososphaeraceae archaeon]
MTSNEQEKKPKNNVALAIIKMPDGKEHEKIRSIIRIDGRLFSEIL